MAYGKAEAENRARQMALDSGAKRVLVTLNHADVYAKSSSGENDIYIESRIEAICTEESEWTA